jgi:hypothetical protein
MLRLTRCSFSLCHGLDLYRRITIAPYKTLSSWRHAKSNAGRIDHGRPGDQPPTGPRARRRIRRVDGRRRQPGRAARGGELLAELFAIEPGLAGSCCRWPASSWSSSREVNKASAAISKSPSSMPAGLARRRGKPASGVCGKPPSEPTTGAKSRAKAIWTAVRGAPSLSSGAVPAAPRDARRRCAPRRPAPGRRACRRGRPTARPRADGGQR